MREHALDGKVRTLSSLGRYEEALVAIDEALERKKDDERALILRARTLQESGREEDALRAIDTAIQTAPKSWEVWRGKASISCALGRHAEEVEAGKKLVALAPNDVRSWKALAGALFEAGSSAEAIAAADRTLELDSTAASAWHLRGDALLRMGRADEALRSFESARSLSDKCERLPIDMAQALIGLGRWDDAIRQLRTSMGIRSDTVDASLFAVIRQVFESVSADSWTTRAQDIVKLFHEANALSVLGAAVVGVVNVMRHRRDVAKAWYTAWELAGKDHLELQLALRLLAAATEYYERSDPKVLFELPTEERRLLETLIFSEVSESAT
jgi:tetratricopeptide (TPR) repeat protein